MPRSKRTNEEIEAMRERILDATLALLRQEGLEGVSIRKIADRVGVSHMLLYSYFENRAEIVQSLRERGLREVQAFFAESLRRAETGDALVQLRESLRRFIKLSREHPMVYQLAWRRDVSLPPDPQNVASILSHLSQLIRLCIQRGQCSERDHRLAGVMAFSLVNGTLMLYYSLPAVGQTAQAELEREVLEAAMTYLTT
jgi:AcrR family transcriptional regulator